METFRRLRSRRKSKGQADSFTSYADAESNYHRSASSPWQTATTATTRSSATASRPSDAEKKFSHDQLRQPISPSDPARHSPAQTSRIQPLLVGISRPTTDSRPVTAGSLQTALDRAAEAVQNQPRGTQSPSSQIGLRAGRYIDIFAISGQPTKPATTFNEDVAERNLDTIALTIEEQHYTYKPTSKYQEEVAARNVPPFVSHRSPSQHTMSNFSHTKDLQDSSTSPRSDSNARHARSEVDAVKSRQTYDLVTYHSRQNSSRVRDGSDYLPVIPQERSSDDFGHGQSKHRDRVQEAELEMERAKARWLGVQRHNTTSPFTDTDKPLPASPQPKENGSGRSNPLRSHPVNHTSVVSESQTMRGTPSTKPSLYPGDHSDTQRSRKFRQDSVQSNVYRPDRRSANTAVTNSSEESRVRSDVSTGPNDRRSYASDASRHTQQRRPSVTSNNSYKRVMVGNRTIMDLTAEDDAEDTSVASYMQTPVIENAREDAFQKVMPTVVDHHSPPPKKMHLDPVVPNSRWSSALEPVLDLDQLARRSQIISETAKAAAAARSQARALEAQRAATPPPASLAFSPIQTMTGSPPSKVITFSTISTLTSITPRSSQEILVTEEVRIPTAQLPVKRVPSKDVLSTARTDSTKEKQNATKSANIAPFVKIFADVHPEETSSKAIPDEPHMIRADSGSQKLSSDQGEISKRNERRREKMARAEAIRAAAKRKIPAGPLDQEPLLGVKTRDFALLPVEKPTNKRIEALSERKRSQLDLKKTSSSSSKSSTSDKKHRSKPSKGTNKVTFDETSVTSSSLQPEKKSGNKSSKSGSSTRRKARPVSIFDEEAFQKKHAEANAALLRLQQSLQEGLDDDSSQVETPRDANTPVSRTLSPVGSVAHGKSPIPQSPSAAAIAMITAATSSPRNQKRPKMNTRASSGSSQNTLRPATMPGANKEENLASYRTAGLNRPNAATLTPLSSDSNKPPPSPGEVSLSSFPIPTPRTMSPESNKSPPAYVKDIDGPVRRGSQGSRVSTASAFSIPFTMVPNRLGSLPENRAGVPGPPNPHQMQSIDAMIPPAHSIGPL